MLPATPDQKSYICRVKIAHPHGNFGPKLPNLLTAGDEAPVRLALKRLSAMRTYMRSDRIGEVPDDAILERVGLTAAETRSMYELLALAKFEDRFVLPTKNRTDETRLFINQGGCGFPEGI